MSKDEKEVETNLNTRNPELIQLVLKNTVNKIASGISLEEFQTILKTLKDKPNVSNAIYNHQNEGIISDFHLNIENMYNETGIGEKYDEITKLINEFTGDTDETAWRPSTGNCEMQLAAYKKKCLLQKKQKLEKLLEEEKNKRILLKLSLDKKRNNLDKLFKQMKKTKQILLDDELK